MGREKVGTSHNAVSDGTGRGASPRRPLTSRLAHKCGRLGERLYLRVLVVDIAAAMKIGRVKVGLSTSIGSDGTGRGASPRRPLTSRLAHKRGRLGERLYLRVLVVDIAAAMKIGRVKVGLGHNPVSDEIGTGASPRRPPSHSARNQVLIIAWKLTRP
jgi:hypothetical protein